MSLTISLHMRLSGMHVESNDISLILDALVYYLEMEGSRPERSPFRYTDPLVCFRLVSDKLDEVLRRHDAYVQLTTADPDMEPASPIPSIPIDRWSQLTDRATYEQLLKGFRNIDRSEVHEILDRSTNVFEPSANGLEMVAKPIRLVDL